MEPRTCRPAPLPSAKEPSHRPAPCPRPEGHVLSQPSLCLGAMSLAGAQGSLWSVEGGNKLVCSGLLKLTKANVIHATVTSVTLQQTGESTGRGRPSWTADTPTFSVPEPWSATSRGGSVEPVGSPALTPEGTVVPSQATAPSGRASPDRSPGLPRSRASGQPRCPWAGSPLVPGPPSGRRAGRHRGRS